MEKLSINLITKNNTFYIMADEVWKCFRCNLIFKDEEHAKLHENLTKHPVSTEKNVAV